MISRIVDIFGFGRHDLVAARRVSMRAEPKLGSAVFDAEFAERDIRDEVERIPWMRERIILVHGLPHSFCVRECRVGREPIPDRLVPEIAGRTS